MQEEKRFINNKSQFEDVNRNPIFGYKDSPLLTLEEAVEELVPIISNIKDDVTTAKKNCYQNSGLLTQDESAAIYLYTMAKPIYSSLNKALRAEDHQAQKPWFAYLKLLTTALEKLPSITDTVWRGIDVDDTLPFVDDEIHIWWSVNSCSKNLNVVQPFLGEQGTLFVIQATHGKDISEFSAMPDEKEVILMPGTRVRRRYEASNFKESLFIIHLDEINPQR
jgi:hypothetical protein